MKSKPLVPKRTRRGSAKPVDKVRVLEGAPKKLCDSVEYPKDKMPFAIYPMLHCSVEKQGDKLWRAECPSMDLVAYGDTYEQAKEKLIKAAVEKGLEWNPYED